MDAAFARYANAALPKRSAPASGLEPYAGTWDKRHASHLLRRTQFGFTRAELDRALGLDAVSCVDALLDVKDEVPAPPISTDPGDPTPVGTTWTASVFDGDSNFERKRSLQSWWMALIMGQSFSVREKMVLFWHNHLATELDGIGDPHFAWRHCMLLRRHALGGFRDLVRQITVDPGMLNYLNGDGNTNANPNENYARELQELFTVGKGPEIGAGDYTHYTEADVKAAARVLTGWRDVRGAAAAEFREKQHDSKDKIFSAAYGNTVIAGRTGPDAGALELDDLMDMIFAHAETAKYLVRKLYRYFVYYDIDATAEANIILPLADRLRKADYQVKPVLAALLKSAHFHDALNTGCQIKNPLDLVAGTIRHLGLVLPDESDIVKKYALMASLVGEAGRMQMELAAPPNVAGWPAYHQDPVYYQVWINSDTLPRRVQFTDRLASAKGLGYHTDKSILSADVLALARSTAMPGTAGDLVSELADRLYPIPLTPLQLRYLKDVLLSGLPDYEWGTEWEDYRATPSDPVKSKPIETRLRALLAAMMQMAEYQLC